MVVRAVRAQGIVESTGSHVGIGYHLQFPEQLQRSIHGGDVDIGAYLLDGSVDILGREVPRDAFDGVEDYRTLGRDTDAVSSFSSSYQFYMAWHGAKLPIL